MAFRRRVKESQSQPQDQVLPLNDAELEWVAANVADATDFAGGVLTPEALDDLWAALLDNDLNDPNPGINLVGLAFGHLLAERLSLDWVVHTDEHGTEIAVRGRADFMVFSTNFIAKRYATRETGFIAPAFREIVSTAESLP